MSDLLNKLSSYNLFNYLLPGTIFAVLGSAITNYEIVHKDIVIGMFLYYFIGLVISRFSSLIIEPLLKKTGFLTFADYKDFVQASKADSKLEVLSEVNNTYRTMCSLFILLLLLKLCESIIAKCPFLQNWGSYILIVLLFIMFLYSYRKQTNYITARIKAN